MKWLELELKFKPSFPNQFMRLGFRNSQTTKLLLVLQPTPIDQTRRNPRLRFRKRPLKLCRKAIAISHLRLPIESNKNLSDPSKQTEKPRSKQNQREKWKAIEFSWKRKHFPGHWEDATYPIYEPSLNL